MATILSGPALKLEVSGARGESFADVGRRLGEIGDIPVASSASDTGVMDALVEAASAYASAIRAGLIAEGATEADFIAYLAGLADGADLSTFPSSVIRFLQQGTGAVERFVQDKLRDVVSVMDFWYAIHADHTTALQAALATGNNVFVPGGRIYRYSDTLKLQFNGQALYGEGNYTTELRWTGTDISKNCIEIISTRRDTGVPSVTRRGMQLRNLVLTGDADAKCANVIWQENGTFHTYVEKIRSEASTEFGFLGEIGESFIRVQGTSLSYNVHPTYRDVSITAVQQGNTALGDPQPCGFWVESSIEGMFDNCFSYGFEECWRLGTPTAANTRNVQNNKFINCLGEIGDRSGLTDNAVSLRIYASLNNVFYGCKFNAGEGWGSATNQRPIRLSGLTGFNIDQTIFHGCAIWGYGYCNYGVVADSTAANVMGVSFEQCDFNNFVLGIVSADAAVDPVINLPLDRNFFTGTPPVVGRMAARGATYDAVSLADGIGETATIMDDVNGPADMPLLASLSESQQGMFFTTYRNSTSGRVVGRLQNETGGTIDLTSAKARVRRIERDEIRAMAAVAYDPPSIAAGAQVTTTITVPGARLGDMARVAFKNAQTNNLSGITLLGYVSADHTVTAIFYNGTTAAINLSSGTLRAVILQPIFDYSGSATYDPASLVDGAGDNTTVTVTGAALGDFVTVSFTNSLGGVMMQGAVSAANTVTVRFQNESGGTVDLASGTILAGVYKRATAI